MFRYLDLPLNLIRKDLSLRYMGSTFGFAWSLMPQLIYTLVFWFIFTYVFPNHRPNFILFILTGIIHWSFFVQAISQSPDTLQGNSSLLQNVKFPYIYLNIAAIATSAIFWLISLSVFFLAYIPLGGHFSWWLLAYPFFAFIFLMFIFGINLFLSVFYIFFHDTKHIIETGMQILFWMTPILYKIEDVPERFHIIFYLNPVVYFITAFHRIVYLGIAPGLVTTLACIGSASLSVAFGYLYYNRNIQKTIERL